MTQEHNFEQCGSCHIVGCAFLIDFVPLGGAQRIAPREVYSLIRYE